MLMQKHCALLSVVGLLLAVVQWPLEAQSPDSTSLREGAWALQFGIAGNFTLTSFQGSTIGAKYQLSGMSAIRGGITVNGNSNDATNTNSGSVNDTSFGTAPGSNSTKSASVSFVLQYVWYTNPNAPLHFYCGIGPLVSYSLSDYSSDSPFFSTANVNGSNQGYWIRESYTSNSTQWGAGGAGVVGIEWFANRWLSLHADYNANMQYRWGSNSSNRDYSSATYPNYIPYQYGTSGTSKGWSVNSSGVAFGLNVYL